MKEEKRPHTVEVISKSLDDTHMLGEKIGGAINTPFVITLHGNLGSGKTAFVQGLGKGLDVPDDYYITSPTYNLINEYPGRLPLFHIDLYRLSGIDDLEDIGFEDVLDSGGVTAIEWPERLPENYLKPDLSIHLVTTDADTRKISISTHGAHPSNLLESLHLK